VGPRAPGRDEAGVSESCEAYATYVDGPYRYVNDQWGRDKATGPFEQCLLRRSEAGNTEYGWTWNWPGLDVSVFAYPEIVFGWKPWSGGASTDPRFPRRISELGRLAIDYEIELRASGSYNLAPEVWLVEEGAFSTAPEPLLIKGEVMFWMDYREAAQPAGEMIATPTIDGVTYELWHAAQIGDRGDGKGWPLFTLKSPEPRHAGTLAIDPLLAHLAEEGLIDTNDFVASVEFGNEIMGGEGTAWIRHFEVDAEP